MQDNNIAHVKKVLNSLRSHYGFKTYGQLAEFLGVKQNTLSSWISRGSFDKDLIYRKCENINFGWLETGTGEMFLFVEAECGEHTNILSEDEQKLVELMRENPGLAKDIRLAAMEVILNARKTKK